MESVDVRIEPDEDSDGYLIRRLDMEDEPVMHRGFKDEAAAQAWVDARNQKYEAAGKETPSLNLVGGA